MEKLKAKERDVLEYIRNELATRGYAPSVRDIQAALGYKSTSTIHMYIRRLEERGYITKEDGKSRTLRVEGGTGLPPHRIPLLGRVTAGQPVLAVEDYEGTVPFLCDRNYREDNLFALRVSGESMIDAGIFDGDIVIVDRRDYAENGEIVVALVEESATVKTFYKEDGHYRLQPQNSALPPIFADEVTILGKVIASLRYYA